MSWDLRALRELIKNKHGDDQLEKANSHINSVDWKIRIAGYHANTSKEAFGSLFNGSENEAIQSAKLILSSGEEAGRFDNAQLVAEANLIACAQSMHSVSDIFSHAIFHSLKLNISNLCEKKLKLSIVQRELEESALKNEITTLLGLKEFCYLKDFVNTTKHISLVFSGYNVNLEDLGSQEHGLKFNAFSYPPRHSSKVRKHPEKCHNDFLQELEKLSIQYVKIGQEINNYLTGESYVK